jgi:hypothetical protein
LKKGGQAQKSSKKTQKGHPGRHWMSLACGNSSSASLVEAGKTQPKVKKVSKPQGKGKIQTTHRVLTQT